MPAQQLFLVLLFCFSFVSFGCDQAEETDPAITVIMTDMIDSDMDMVAEEPMNSIAECQAICDVLLECGWTLACNESSLSDARSSCRSLCQGDNANQINSLAGSTCTETEASLPGLLGIDCSSSDLCADVNCGQGTCDSNTGNCIDPCSDILCEAGSYCEQGTCVASCTEACGEGERCDDNSRLCVALCDQVNCSDTESCEPSSGQCVPKCNAVECETGLSCEATTGECINLCADSNCEEGLTCDSSTGECIDLCMNISCNEGWTCDAGECVIDYPCSEVECPTFNTCNPDTAMCELYTCLTDVYEIGFTNNLPTNATVLPSETQRIDDLHICFADTDWYSVVVPADTAAQVRMYSSPGSGALMLGWYNPEDFFTPIYESDSQSSPEVINVPASETSQTIYLRVSSANGMIAQNRYTLTIELGDLELECNGTGAESVGCDPSAACDNGRCVVEEVMGGMDEMGGMEEMGGMDEMGGMEEMGDMEEMAGMEEMGDMEEIDSPTTCANNDEYEPNPSFAEATPIDNDQIMQAYICPDDLDLYVLTLNEESDLNINVSFTHTDGDIDVYIMSADMVIIDESESASDHENLVVGNVMPGTYYIGVYGYFEYTENSYSITVDSTPSLN